jgi:hypothetical protein
MGSSGSGKFSDYPGSGKSTGAGGSGAGAPLDRCGKAFSVRLEDVEHSQYFKTHGKAPPIQTRLEITQQKRLIARTMDGLSVGNLPTSSNYLAACLKDGWSYLGTVQDVRTGAPVATVLADFAAVPPK